MTRAVFQNVGCGKQAFGGIDEILVLFRDLNKRTIVKFSKLLGSSLFSSFPVNFTNPIMELN